MPKKMVQLIFPQALIKEPVVYNMAIKCSVIPNIRRAKVTESVGEMVLELEGENDALEQGIQYLQDAGVNVQPVSGDVIQ
tara:strand:- start:320 stop:559 length:240 start_codon:yes stop_codon:yes gene_type:complete